VDTRLMIRSFMKGACVAVFICGYAALATFLLTTEHYFWLVVEIAVAGGITWTSLESL